MPSGTHHIPFLHLLVLTTGLTLATQGPAQITVPDRLPNGQRAPAFVTPAERGTLPFDSVRTLPTEQGGRDTWWHRHALFTDGNVRLALDPVVDLSQDRRRVGGDTPSVQRGHRNVRGVRYAGTIDDRVRFGGKVLEMQRVLVGPETEYVLAANGYPGMGPGKLRPAGDGLMGIDHSLAEVWFDTEVTNALRIQCGLGSTGLGAGARNLLWNPDMAPAPFLLLELDLGQGWTYRWVQSRQRSTLRLPADGAREGRYDPMGLGIRSLGKTLSMGEGTLDLHYMVARWTHVLDRGTSRSGLLDWAEALAPWPLPFEVDSANPKVAAGHHGLDVQWRRAQSTWYAQVRFSPWRDDRYRALRDNGTLDPAHVMVGHVRHGDHWTFWAEYSPLSTLAPATLDVASSGGSLGTRALSSLQPDWIVGAEVRPVGATWAVEWGRISDGWTLKNRVAFPTSAVDSAPFQHRKRRKSTWPNRILPALIPLTPFVEHVYQSRTNTHWWSMGIASPITNSRQVF